MMSTAATAEGITFGVKAGMVFAGISDTPVFIDGISDWENSMRKGLMGGIFMNYEVAGSFSIQPELLFVMKGFELSYSDSDEDLDIDVTGKFNYIEIPLLARFSIPVEGAFSPWFCFGPSFGFNISHDVEGDFSFGGSPRQDISGDFDDVTKKNEFSLIIGGGFEYPFGKGTLTFDIRYELGLTKIIDSGEVRWTVENEDEEYPEDLDEQDAKNEEFVIMFGYAF